MALTLEGLDGRATALERAQGETSETLRWVVTKLARVQAAQDEHTLRLERVETKVDAVAAEVVELRSEVVELRSEVVDLRSEVRAMPRVVAEMIAESETRLRGTIAASEARLLAAIGTSR